MKGLLTQDFMSLSRTAGDEHHVWALEIARHYSDLAGQLPRLAELAVRYADQSPDFADIRLIRMSELSPKHSVITTDLNDFRVYRRGKREAIPLICPP